MNTNQLLENRIKITQSFLCVGLDPDQEILEKLGMQKQVADLNMLIIDSLAHLACAFKPQFAHYAALGQEQALYDTCHYIKQKYPHIPILLDAKRGDIGNTADKYAIEAYQRYGVDAVTINPYMGRDTIDPFLLYPDKAAIVLIKTSNPSSREIQDLILQNGEKMFLYIAKLISPQRQENIWFVVGGTQIDAITALREQFPTTTFLVPGVGSQGGDIDDIVKFGMTKNGMGLVINVSRGITAPCQEFSTLDEYIALIKTLAMHFYVEIKRARLLAINGIEAFD